jgi:hypothetical protein
MQPATRPAAPDPPYGDALCLIGGAGIVLMQAAAVIPGLLPVLLLTLPFAVPLVALGIVAGILIGVPLALWRLAAQVVRRLRRRVVAQPAAGEDPASTGVPLEGGELASVRFAGGRPS